MIGGSDLARELAAIKPWADRAAPISRDERKRRVAKARRLMDENGADALLVCAGASLLYFTGVGWGMIERLVALLLTPEGKPVLVVPTFEIGSLMPVLELECEIAAWEEHESPSKLIADLLARSGAKSLAIDPALPFGMAVALQNASSLVQVSSAASIIDGCRALKSPAEIALMQQAKNMTLEVQRHAALALTPGVKASAMRRFIDEAHKAIGSAGSTFCIVQFGASSAYPHGLPQDDILQEGDMVLIDTGCAIQGYNSDITRSYVFGTPDDEQRRIWNIEQEAQQAAFDTVRPGVACEQIDRAARRVLDRHGLGPGYALPGLPHRTGHGIGISIHEGPYLVPGDLTPLAPGMCFSNEPMIVVPGKFGVRLEDHFHVTDDGAAWFTRPSPSIDRPFA